MSKQGEIPNPEEVATEDFAVELISLLSRRTQLQALIDRFSAFLAVCTIQKLVEARVRLSKVEIIWDELDQIQSRIEQIDASDEQRDVRVALENSYFTVISEAHEFISKNTEVQVQNSNAVTSTQGNSGSNIVPNSHAGANLPSINLPIFSGSYEGWLQFFEIFRSIVDQNDKLSKIQKLYYLQSCLRGEASQILHSLEMSDTNYDVAVELLKERYENKRILIHSHVKGLFDLLPVAKESHASLRKLLDTFTKNFRALKSLGEPVEQWDTLLIHLIVTKLDFYTRKEWETSVSQRAANLNDLLSFLKNKCQTLETLDNKVFDKNLKFSKESYKPFTQKSSEKTVAHVVTGNINYNCTFCKQSNHYTYKCQKLMSLSLKERYQELKGLNICTNCLKFGHKVDTCTSSKCRLCGNKHNSILHDFDYKSQAKPTEKVHVSKNQNSSCNVNINGDAHLQTDKVTSINVSPDTENSAQVALTSHADQEKTVLLATAIIYILDRDKNPIKCRALLDSASQSNFCTKELHDRLGLSSTKINMPVSGINQVSSNIYCKFTSRIQSVDKAYTANLQFLVINHITSNLPQTSFDSQNLDLPSNITLADKDFNVSQNVDVLLGTEVFFELMNKEQIILGPNKPVIQNTRLGWILAGPVQVSFNRSKQKSHCFLSTTLINETLEKFWNVENVEVSQNKLSNEELECEVDFLKNVEQDSETGRFTVKLPLKENVTELGDSLRIAQDRFLSTEKRLSKNSELKQHYISFLREYEALGHMTKVEAPNDASDIYYYMPHHAVMKNTSSTTKVRIVFDASCKSVSGLSLNDVLKIGPKVQNDIFDIILRMRTYPIVISADVEKMYRMIMIHESQRNLQRIVWRENSDQPLSHFVLNTVTYGTGSASFLATRVLNEIGVRCKESHPKISEIIINDFYMDDLITGASTLKEAVVIKHDIDRILSDSGFRLRKWLSNDIEIFEQTELTNANKNQFHIKSDIETKTLGVSWDPVEDIFNYSCNFKFNTTMITKRTILSGVAQLFDPLGLISPVIVGAKLVLQQLWREQLDWDQPVSAEVERQWRTFTENMTHLEKIKISRFVAKANANTFDIHGFCDSSESAYGACIYLRSSHSDGTVVSNLLCSKSRIAPLSSHSLPRLELCGALLLAQLMHKVTNALRMKIDTINYWTDSQIVLAWLKEQPCRWKSFVGNRVAEIQRLCENGSWRHVESFNNPADIVSRGAQPLELQGMSLWWHGPAFLQQAKNEWPTSQLVSITDIPEVRKTKIVLSYVSNTNKNFLFDRWSSYSKMLNVFSYVLRFVRNCRSKDGKSCGPLTINELDQSVTKLCRLVQTDAFSKEIKLLEGNHKVHKESKLTSLNPFLDTNGILRVGGRLKNSHLSYDAKHQIILPAKHKFSHLLIQHFHHKYMHAGPQFLLSQIRAKFWPLNGRNEIRSVLRKCLTCFRVKPSSPVQIMGALPEARVTPSRPFTCCGLDYAGPYFLKDGKTRSRITVKAYVCIFICMSSRAVHAELVTDLSSEAFLNAFKRFVSRRGLAKHVFSDNATNFVGSNSELQKLCKIVSQMPEQKTYREYFSENRIVWHHIPPRSPHHGGIWESAVKSFKYHLKRVIGEANLHFEQFYTILTQIEAILNSRPILPLSSDPNDLQALTPGHFLIGDSLVAVPQENVSDIASNRLKHFKQLQQIVQQFWIIWSKDYLHNLQQRGKWRTQTENIEVNDMVLLKEENLPPMQWLLGRVVAVHPGKDELVRVVSVRTKKGVFKRAITQVSPLPKD